MFYSLEHDADLIPIADQVILKHKLQVELEAAEKAKKIALEREKEKESKEDAALPAPEEPIIIANFALDQKVL